jgi:hypothetical protein
MLKAKLPTAQQQARSQKKDREKQENISESG